MKETRNEPINPLMYFRPDMAEAERLDRGIIFQCVIERDAVSELIGEERRFEDSCPTWEAGERGLFTDMKLRERVEPSEKFS